ncbi:UBX domain-containing protein 4 isoform X2 [Athalia rosae]|uniref:UBX domain-containing protein 4 isoform X2 n=1 Tax=Athalia rosae TaxID=37344 RepID=UPI0020339790|nr:UBX domain-containing protein 4 isoform X2 [Athalia rosae]
MKWFQGGINEAVAASKSRKAIFVVFVEGKDDASVEIAKVVDSGEISSRLERDEFVAIKLEGGSESYGFFAQIYKLVPVPSLFFIGQNGAPIEVIAGETSIADLMTKIDTILKKVEPAQKDSSTSLIQAEQNVASLTISAKPSEAEISTTNLDTAKSEASMAPLPTTSKQHQDSETTDSVTAKPSPAVPTPETKPLKKLDTPSQSSSVSEIPELTAEEKLERARQLIELKKQQREEEEARKARESEIERRKTGQELLKLKQKQQDLEIKQAYEERQREKAAEAAAKERVRQQIAQDKIERKQRELNRQQQSSQPSPVQEQPKPRTPTANDSGIVRIQFRLPSGTPHMGQFESTITLGALRAYIVDNIELPFRQFALSTSFPRRELTAADDGKTLVELELVPSAVILILPVRNSNNTAVVTSAQDDGYLSRFMWAIFASIASAFGYIRAYFTGIPPRPTVHQNSSSTTSSTDGPISPSAQTSAPPPGLIRRNLGGQGSTTIRAQGNIHRLNSSGDQDSDENNTWNGNSTQQM